MYNDYNIRRHYTTAKRGDSPKLIPSIKTQMKREFYRDIMLKLQVAKNAKLARITTNQEWFLAA